MASVQKVNTVYLTYENQTVTLVCPLDKSLPAVIHLTNDSGHEDPALLTPALGIRYTIQRIKICRCEDVWPYLNCDGKQSTKNRFVAVLLRCPPSFVGSQPITANLATHQQVTFRIKSHTRQLERCLMAPASGKALVREVSCSMTGDPPDMLLAVQIYKEDNFLPGNWTLIVRNEVGAANTTLCLEDTGSDVVFDNLSDDTISIAENDYIHFTFGVNMSACTHLDTVYEVAVKTNTSGGITEEDGRVELTKDTCTVTTAKHVTCASRNGVAELYRRVNRSHVQQEWRMFWRQGSGDKPVQRRLLLNVFYRSSVTSLMVDGQEVNVVHLVHENQTIFLNCSFDKGNPPTVFRLISESGKDVTPALARDYLMLPVTIGPPTFLDVRPNVTNLATYQQFTFHIRSHTREMSHSLGVQSVDKGSELLSDR